MVFEKFVSIYAETPGIGIVVDTQQPTAQMVALFVHKNGSLFVDFSAAGNKGSIKSL